jgi:hypothetical protein
MPSPASALWQDPGTDIVPGAYYRWVPVHYLPPSLRLLRPGNAGTADLLPPEMARQRFLEGRDEAGIDAAVCFVRWRPVLVLHVADALPSAIRRRERGGDHWVLPLYSIRGAGFAATELAALQGRRWVNARFLRGDPRFRIDDAYVDFRRAQLFASTYLVTATQVARLDPEVIAALRAAFARFLEFAG